MKNSIRTCAPQFRMRRMVKEYMVNLYLPAAGSGVTYQSNGYAVSKQMAAWKERIRKRWNTVGIEAISPDALQIVVGESLDLEARVWLSSIPEEDVSVEIVAGRLTDSGSLIDLQVVPMAKSGMDGDALHYSGTLRPQDSGQLGVGVRIRPDNSALINTNELGLNVWSA